MTSAELDSLYEHLVNGGAITSCSRQHVEINNTKLIIEANEHALYELLIELVKIQRLKQMVIARLKPHWKQGNHEGDK